MKSDGTGNVKLIDEKSECINVIGDRIYYTSVNGGYLYTMKTDGTGRVEVK